MVTIDDELIPFLDEMYMDLSTHKLEVCLIPYDRDGRCVRAAHSQNVDWYQKLCEHYPCTRQKKRNPRKDGTVLKRRNVMHVLEGMIRRKTSRSKYALDLLQIAEDTKKLYDELQAEEEKEIPWDNQF